MHIRGFCLAALTLVLTSAAVSCGVDTRLDGQRAGWLSIALEGGASPHGVTAARVDVLAAVAGCTATPIASHTVALDADATRLAGSGGAPARAFSDALFVLAPGDYHVCVTPLAGDAPSTACAAAEANVSVAAEATREIMLVLQCAGAPMGGLAVAAALNDPPQITGLTIVPSKFITVCEAAEIQVAATDPDADGLVFAFALQTGPVGSYLGGTGATGRFAGPAGEYTLEASVMDGYAGRAALSFPIHVSDALCAVPPAVAEIFGVRCSPCHTARAAGGLLLAPDTRAEANLIGQPATGANCTTATRVIPGDAANSYLIAKLRGSPDICGARMPRNQPALPEAEIQTIEDWINALPN